MLFYAKVKNGKWNAKVCILHCTNETFGTSADQWVRYLINAAKKPCKKPENWKKSSNVGGKVGGQSFGKIEITDKLTN